VAHIQEAFGSVRWDNARTKKIFMSRSTLFSAHCIPHAAAAAVLLISAAAAIFPTRIL
jgi:hypothetical protein